MRERYSPAKPLLQQSRIRLSVQYECNRLRTAVEFSMNLTSVWWNEQLVTTTFLSRSREPYSSEINASLINIWSNIRGTVNTLANLRGGGMRARQSVTIILVEDKVSDFPFASNFSTNSFRYIFLFLHRKFVKIFHDENIKISTKHFHSVPIPSHLFTFRKLIYLFFIVKSFVRSRESSNYFYLITIVIEIYGYWLNIKVKVEERKKERKRYVRLKNNSKSFHSTRSNSVLQPIQRRIIRVNIEARKRGAFFTISHLLSRTET